MPSKKDYSEDINSFFFNEQNKKKTKELKEKFGMQGMESSDNASPELVNNFLNSVQQFEEAFEKAESKKINEILEFPIFKKIDELNPENISTEINNVIEKYEKHNIYVDVIEKDDVSNEDFYKFLTEELPEHITDFIEIEGMMTNYIYEEFHPSNKLDAKNAIDSFLYALLNKNKDYITTYLSNDKLSFNGKVTTLSKFIESMLAYIPKNVIDHKIIFKEFEFNKRNLVKVDFFMNFKELIQKKFIKNQKILHLLFELQKSEYGGLEIISCNNEQ